MGVNNANLYEIWKKENHKTITVDFVMRIPKEEFTATLRIGELLGLTRDEMDISEEAIANNRAYVIISKQDERVSRDAVEALNLKEIILIYLYLPALENFSLSL